MDTSLSDDGPARHPVLLRMLVVAGTLFGFTLLALLASHTADASERPRPPDRPGALAGTGQALHDVLEPGEQATRSAAEPAHAVSSRVAAAAKPVARIAEPAVESVAEAVGPVVKPVAKVADPVAKAAGPVTRVAEPVVKPVTQSAEPVLSALRPVTRPVVGSLDPVTRPILRVTDPVTGPVLGADEGGGQTAPPAPQSRPDQAVAGSADRTVALVDKVQRHHTGAASVVSRHESASAGAEPAFVPEPMSGSGGGGGVPVGSTGVSGAVPASGGGAHGGEYAVAPSGSQEIGTSRAWRAPPGGPPSLYWLVSYGNDHPS
ncbi:hypothetical protein [Amycolatopsis jiangsuensis]|uniref:Uncharacterized protein n=1 Tax=Amycolatopsis jiangsuensis TaxID=1181879 RepID=A0A840J6W0_9PSEU|nr:hypothetical protein [Amycolatopsis jiangsuensis]MBB4689172.1 hypothetical protein [Amycolatopsis jiangsuensis]